MSGKRMLFATLIAAVGVLLLITAVAAQGPALTPIEQLGKFLYFD